MAGNKHDELFSGGTDPSGGSLAGPNPQDRADDPNGVWYATPNRVAPSFNNDVNRYRQQGAQTQQANQLDQTQADQSRGLQMSALDMLRQQGNGQAPSSADILSQRANQDAIRNAGQQVTGAKSTGGALAALRGAGDAAGQTMLAGNAQNANARGAEISHGQGAYFGGTTGIRGQDIGAATTNAQLEARQRLLNEQHQQTNERLAWDTRNTAMGAANDAADLETRRNQQEAAARSADKAQDWEKTKDTFKMGLGPFSGSDERMKTHIGSLSSLTRGRH